jgi:hypothetical protein
MKDPSWHFTAIDVIDVVVCRLLMARLGGSTCN